MSNRIGWIDSIRGAGIILVILGHMQIPELADKIIFSFHMPLFFFLSGYLYNDGFDVGWFAKKVDGLIVPYVLYGLITIASSYLRDDGHFFYWIKSGICGNGIGLTWFFMCLFMAEIVGAALVRRLGSHGGRISLPKLVVAMLTLVLGAYLIEKSSLGSIMMSRSFLSAAVFWLGGYACSRFGVVESIGRRNLLFLVPVLPALFVNGKIDMAWGHLGCPLITYPVAFSFILVMIAFVREFLPRNRTLAYIGSRSMLFMMWHSLLPPLIKWLAMLVGVDVDSSMPVKIVQRVVNLVLMFAVVWWLDRRVVCLTGKWRPFSKMVNSLSGRGCDRGNV